MPHSAAPATESRYPSTDLIECPFPHFDRAREERPVEFDEGSQIYVVYRHEDITFVLGHPEIFPHQPVHDNGIMFGGVPLISSVGPPEHTAMRRLAFEPLKPGRLKSYEPVIAEISDSLIDAFQEHDSVDFVEQFAIPLPARVVCRLMDFPEEGPDFEFIVESLSMKSADRPGTSDVGIGFDRGAKRTGIHDYIRDALEERHANPGNDILTEILQTQIARDGSLNLPLLMTICTELAAGGVITTAQMMVNALMLLLAHPDQMARVRADHKLIPWVLEESLRLESPVQSEPRISVADATVGGVHVPAGSTVLLVLGSGNRDPERFTEADRFDIDRPRDQIKAHLGFGYGMHFCLGAPLARLEGTIGFRRLFDRLAEIRLAEGNDFAHIASTHFRALRSLHIDFDRP